MPMTYNRLGNTGLKVSAFSYGAWVSFSTQLGVDKAYEIMKVAYEGGVNFFDNAELYAYGEAETIMGQCIQRGIDEGVWKRTDLVISTKIYFGDGGKGPNDTGLSRKHILEGTKKSLERFKLDYVDLLLCHRYDENTPIEEVVRAFNFLIDTGCAMYWGTSEWPADKIHEACDVADKLGLQKPLFEQPQYNMYERTKVEKDYLSLYERMGLGLTVWSPLASGVLTGKYSKTTHDNVEAGSRLALKDYAWLKNSVLKDENKWKVEKADAIKPIADEIGCTRAQLALVWCLKNKNVSTVILGATKVEQIKENLLALELVDKVTDAHMEKLEAILGTKPQL